MTESTTGIGARSPAHRSTRWWWLPTIVVGHAVALVGFLHGSWWAGITGLVAGQSAVAGLLTVGHRTREDDPVFVDRPPKRRRGARRLGALSSSRAARTRADHWLLVEHLLSVKSDGAATLPTVSKGDVATYAIVSERSMVPLERFASLAEANGALAGVRRHAPTLGARLLVVDLVGDSDARGTRSAESTRADYWGDTRGAAADAGH